MVKALLLSVLMIFVGALVAVAEDIVPAGYVTSVALVGEDATAKTVIVRDGAELPARIMMPVFAEDIVFLRDAGSRIIIETGDGKKVEVGGSVMRFTVTGEIDTGDGTWGIISAIGGVFAGDEEPAPENMVSKGGTLKMPVAVRGTNILLKGRRTLWLGWEGGKAPFTVSLAGESGETIMAERLASSETEITLPDKVGGKFTLVLRDAEQQKVQLRFRFADALPENAPQSVDTIADVLARAAWLTGQGDGAWSIEAAQLLKANGSEAAQALLGKITGGWRYAAP